MRADQVIDSPGRGVTSPYAIEVTSADGELPALEDDWNRLSAASEHPNVFMTYGWFSAWSRRLQKTPGRLRPHVLVLKEGNAVVGIAPLIRRELSPFGIPVRMLEFATNHSDYNDLIVGEDNAGLTAAVVDFLARTADQWEILDLRNLRNTGNSIAHIESALVSARLRYRLFPEAERCPYMPIDAPLSQISTKELLFARYAFRKFAGKASEGYRVRIVENPQLELDLLKKMIAVEAQKQVGGKQYVPLFGEHRELFQSLLDALGPLGWIKVVLIEWNDRVVAYLFLYCCGKKLWDYQTAYDRAFSSLSLGTVLVCTAIDYAFANGLDEFDFLRGDEFYKQRWTKDFHQNGRLLIWNHRWKSRFSAFAYLNLRVRHALGIINLINQSIATKR